MNPALDSVFSTLSATEPKEPLSKSQADSAADEGLFREAMVQARERHRMERERQDLAAQQQRGQEKRVQEQRSQDARQSDAKAEEEAARARRQSSGQSRGATAPGHRRPSHLVDRFFNRANAGGELLGAAEQSDIREIVLGKGTVVRVFGPTPSDAELAALARANGMGDEALARLDLDAATADGIETASLLEGPGSVLDELGSSASIQSLHPLALNAEMTAPGQWDLNGAESMGLADLREIDAQALLTDGADTSSALDGLGAPMGPGTLDSSENALARLGLSGKSIEQWWSAEPVRARVPMSEGILAALASRFEAGTDSAAIGPDGETSPSTTLGSALKELGVKIDPLVMRGVVFERMADIQRQPSTAERLASLQAADLGAQGLEAEPIEDLGTSRPGSGSGLSQGAAPSSGGNSSSGGSAGSWAGSDGSGRQSGQQLAQQFSQRFAELVSQRLVQQIQNGHWKVHMDIHPEGLGELQIELDWRGGELEASFRASQVGTRELLADQLPRLKEALERAGTEVASMTVGDQSRQKSGDQAGHNRNRGQHPATETGGDTQAVGGIEALSLGQTPLDGRLNVLV
ncbi:MAG: Flagellar hook-length control protein FliK [Pseudomonadota bacterium]